MNKAFIKHISFYTPSNSLNNEKISEEFPEWNAEKIFDKVGITNRYIANQNECASDLATYAAKTLFDTFQFDKNQIDFLIFCTQSPDYFLPASSCILHNNLNLPKHTGSIDINQGCSGYVYGLSLAKSLIVSGTSKNVLLITGDTYSKYLSKNDKGNRTIFGDAATATLISTDGSMEIQDFIFGTDGSGANNLIIKNGANRNPIDFDNPDNPDNYLYMNGSEIFNFTLEAVPVLVDQILMKNKLDKSDIDMFVFHQANKFMLETLRKVCKIDNDKFYNNFQDTGNTVSSTIPICLYQLLNSNSTEKLENILLAGFGVGYSWAGCNLSLNYQN